MFTVFNVLECALKMSRKHYKQSQVKQNIYKINKYKINEAKYLDILLQSDSADDVGDDSDDSYHCESEDNETSSDESESEDDDSSQLLDCVLTAVSRLTIQNKTVLEVANPTSSLQ